MRYFLAILAVFIFSAFVLGGQISSMYNREVALRTQIEQVQTDNKNVYDTMWKKIAQAGEVTQAERESLERIITDYAQARAQGRTDNNGTALAVGQWVQEAIPNVDNTTYRNLVNIITSSRDDFAAHQTRLLDLQREYNTMLRTFPNNIVLVGLFGKKEVNVTIVTSTKTEKSFESGIDDDVQVLPTVK